MMPLLLGGVACLVAAGPAPGAQRLDLSFASEEWATETKGAFTTRLDRRGVLTASHGTAPARAGDHATLSRVVGLPDKPGGAVVLRFYLTDDYVGDREQAVYFRDAVKERVSDWKEEVRFAQVLLDDVVVWSRDVIGPNPTTAGGRFCDLDITELIAKKSEVEVSFRVRDDHDTGEVPFPSDVFWARPELIWGVDQQPPPVEFPPRLPFRREGFPSAATAPATGTVALTVRNPSGVSLPEWPIRWGVPLPQGAITRATQLLLRDAAGNAVELQARTTARWPDGSAKWVLLDFVAPLAREDTTYDLRYGAGVPGASDGEALGGVGTGELAAVKAVRQRPPVVVLPPGWVASTGVFGPFQERDETRLPEYEAAADGIVERLTDGREGEPASGWEHLGDSPEYDAAHALLGQFLRTGDPDAFYLGSRAAVQHRLLDPVATYPPTISDHWTEGLLDYWLLTGDTRSLERANRAAEDARCVALEWAYGGNEGDAGWNLIALVATYCATGDAALLEAARKKVEEVLAYLDPVRGVSSVRIHEQTAYEGGTPFMTGILMRGLVMYYEETHDERVGWAICGLCDWLECEMMPTPGRFHYKQAPDLKQPAPCLLLLDGAAFAWAFTGDPSYRKLALAVYREGVGTTDITNMRDMPHALALLGEMGE